MKVAVMQPYIFPYIGYFQLINAVDVFVFYDDVNFIKQGWVNRNKILVSAKEMLFTIPLTNASSFTTIKETQINLPVFNKWRSKFLRTIEQSYRQAPYFEVVYSMIAATLNDNFISISDLAKHSIINVSGYLNMNTRFETSSEKYSDIKSLEREVRLIEIIKRNDAKEYINPIGGQELYTKESFAKCGIDLKFIKSKPVVYKQFENEFVPWLSIIDVLMFNSPSQILEMMNQYEFL